MLNKNLANINSDNKKIVFKNDKISQLNTYLEKRKRIGNSRDYS